MTLTMYDSISVSQIPAQAACIAGYVDGNWQTFPVLQRAFPHARLLSITVTASTDADVLDVENGDATIAQAPAWVKRQQARGLYRPGVYAQASNMAALLAALEAAGIARASVRLWSAHYDLGAHICGPGTCRYPGIPACDGTQWTPAALGRDLDESLLLADFFDPRPAPKPAPAQTSAPEDTMLLNRGKNAVTPIVLAPGDKTLYLLGSTPGAEVIVHFGGQSPETAKELYFKDGAEAFPVPAGCTAAEVTRVDGGTNDVGWRVA